MSSPKRTRLCKQHRGRMKEISYRGNDICFGKYALQTLEPDWIASRQIEAGQRAMTRNACRVGKVWVYIFPDKPVKPGRILYEIGGVT